MEDERRLGIGSDGFPNEDGVFVVREEGERDEDAYEVDVYEHPIKGLSVWSEGVNREGSGTYDDTDDHISVHTTGLVFIRKVRDLNEGV